MSKIKCKAWHDKLPAFKYAQAKLDGIWLTVEDEHAFTSHPTDITEKLQYLHWWKRVCEMSKRFTVHGELCFAGKPASYVKSAIAQQHADLDFVGFAVESESMGPAAGLGIVEEQFNGHGIQFAPWHALDYRQQPELIMQYYELGVLANYHRAEGVVYKNGNLLDWYKWKQVRTIDLVVTGLTDGAGKYEGLYGSLRCSVYVEGSESHAITCEVANVSGMDDDTRELITRDDIGRVCEVAYQYVGSKGRLRHPRFVRWRDDKPPHECTPDQDCDLEEALL